MDNGMDHQHLIFDADDTLWECNRYFEETISAFFDRLDHLGLDRQDIRAVLDKHEHVNGYGSAAFTRSMLATLDELHPHVSPDERSHVERIGMNLLNMELAPIAGVEETLAALRAHHQLILFTKGEEMEQRAKIDRSPLSAYFDQHIVTPEKTVQTYRDIVRTLSLDSQRTWMIGNSRRSDIQPALAAGLYAVYIPNPHTWHVEHLDIEHHPDWQGKSFECERFSDLLSLFRHR